jgi:hypothetical protein
MKKVLTSINSVNNIRHVGSLPLIGTGIHIEFNYHDIPYIVYEPWADCSEWWILPADGSESDEINVHILELKNTFKKFKPRLLARIVGYFLNLMFFKKNGWELIK